MSRYKLFVTVASRQEKGPVAQSFIMPHNIQYSDQSMGKTF